MDLYINIEAAEDGRHYLVDHKRYHDANRAALKKAFLDGTMPEEIHLVNWIPEKNFREELVLQNRPEIIQGSLKCLMKDCSREDSSLCRYLADMPAEDEAGKKADIFLRVMEKMLDSWLAVYTGSKEEKSVAYDVFYGDPTVDALEVLSGCHAPYFVINLPEHIIDQHYAESEKDPDYGHPRFFDLERLNQDEMADYVIPQYYKDLGWWDRKSVREDPKKMEYLTDQWMETLFAALK